jgi:hypothetical protein
VSVLVNAPTSMTAAAAEDRALTMGDIAWLGGIDTCKGEIEIVDQWSCLTAVDGAPHRRGTRLGVWTRPPARSSLEAE